MFVYACMFCIAARLATSYLLGASVSASLFVSPAAGPQRLAERTLRGGYRPVLDTQSTSTQEEVSAFPGLQTAALFLGALLVSSQVARAITLEEFMEQDAKAQVLVSQGCLIKVEGKAYDVGPYALQHKGGAQNLAKACCTDASELFKANHQWFAAGAAQSALERLPVIDEATFAASCPRPSS